MKKIFFAIVLILLISPVSFAASSDQEIYVRQDVFDAKMEALFERIDKRLDKLEAKIDKNYADLNAKIDKNYAELNAKIDKNYTELNYKIDKNSGELSGRMYGLEGKMEGFEYKLEAVNDTVAFRLSLLTLAVAIVGLFFAFFTWKNSNANITLPSPSLTREDIVQIFEQMFAAKTQNLIQANLGR